MARLAVFIDGGYLDVLAEKEFNCRLDYRLLCEEITAIVAAGTAEPLDLLRTYYYHCLPFQSSRPTPEESERYARKRRFFDALRRLPRFEVREGRLAFVGMHKRARPIFQQKRTDMLLGLDVALLSAKKQITHAAVLTGDSDFLPALEVASQEGVAVWLFHGPSSSSSRASSYAQELWLHADERYEINRDFMQRVGRSQK